MSLEELRKIAEGVVDTARQLGAEEASVRVGEGSYSQLQRRDGQVEKAQESRSRSAGISLMVDGRYSSHRSNDLREEALRNFLERAVEATRFMEEDPDRRLPDPKQMGIAQDDLDAVDPAQATRTPDERRREVEELEGLCRAVGQDDPVRSITAYIWDGRSDSALVTSNGFASTWSATNFGHGATISLEDEDGRLPEAYSVYKARHIDDLPTSDQVAEDLLARGRRRLGSGAVKSGRYPLVLDRRVVGRLLRVLIGPLSGTAVYEGRSCLADKLDQRIGSERFTLLDDPLIPRASASRPHDGDGLPAQRRPVVEDGVLKMHYLGIYNARRLGREPTTGGASNLVVPVGDRSPDRIIEGLDRGILVDGFLGGNTNATSGDFSFGIHGMLIENGTLTRPVSEMNVAGNLFELLDRFTEAADDVWVYSNWRCPSLLFDDIQFSGL